MICPACKTEVNAMVYSKTLSNRVCGKCLPKQDSIESWHSSRTPVTEKWTPSRREYFASMALANCASLSDYDRDSIAIECVKMADRIIEELDK